MSLFKKTIILTNQKTAGFLTLVKIGSSVGIKVVLNDYKENLKLCLKLKDDTFYFDIPFEKLETEIKYSDFNKEEICVIIVDGDTIFARGGKRDSSFELASRAHYATIEYTPVTATETNEDVAETDEIAQTQPSQVDSNGFDFFKPQTDKNFYLSIIDKIEEMMTVYPLDDTLNNALEGGRFVKVMYDDDEFYSVGTISVDGKVKYIVYAIEGLKDVLPPLETQEVADFLPIDEDNGYWVIMQDAITGETIKKEVD